MGPLAYLDSGSGSIAILLVLYAAVLVLFVVGWVKILSKAGYSGAWVLIGLVPIANLVMFLVFAFSDWPVVRAQRAAQAGLPPGYGYPPGDGGYSGYAGSGQSLGATPGSTPGGVSPPQPIPGQVYPPPGDGPQV